MAHVQRSRVRGAARLTELQVENEMYTALKNTTF